MKYPGTNIYTDGSKYRRGAACFVVIVLCDDRFLCEITNTIMDVAVTAGQMETEAIGRAIAWVAEHPDSARPPYRLFTDHKPFVDMYNGPNWSRRNGDAGQAIKKGKEIGLEISHIPAHLQEHNGNKTCDITCRALCGTVLRDGIKALSLVSGKAAIADGRSQYSY